MVKESKPFSTDDVLATQGGGGKRKAVAGKG